MEKRISKEAYESYRKTVDENVPLKRAAADEIAKAMMAWAIENGVYTGEVGALHPQDKASRALVAQMLYGFAEVLRG